MVLGAILQGVSKNIWTLIFWRCLTGLFAGSQIVTVQEAVISAAFIIGPAIGGFLGSKNYSFPLYFAGGVAGIALLFALFMMEETNKDVHAIYELRSEMKGKTGGR